MMRVWPPWLPMSWIGVKRSSTVTLAPRAARAQAAARPIVPPPTTTTCTPLTADIVACKVRREQALWREDASVIIASVRTALALAIAISMTGCAPAPTPEPTMPEPTTVEPTAPEPTAPEPTASDRPAPWRIVYADGSANVSRLDRPGAADPIQFVYDPVTPAESSTGTYSGGPPRTEQVAADDPRVDALWREVERLEADTSVHVRDRAKGTGAFTITTPSGERSFLVKGGATLQEIERILARLGAP